MPTKEELLPIHRMIHLNNEKEIAEVHLEGLEPTHRVISHNGGITVKSLNSSRQRKLNNADIHYLTPNDTGGWHNNVLESRPC